MISLLSEPQAGPGAFLLLRIGAGGKKQESHWAWQRQRLVSPQCGVDWPAQPYLKLAQDYFSRISKSVSIVLRLLESAVSVDAPKRAAYAAFELFSVGSVKDCRHGRTGHRYSCSRSEDHLSTF
jgi:hypothetical protein